MQAFRITLPDDMAMLVKEKVASGEYATESDVFREGLMTIAIQDAAFETWLHDEVLPTVDALAREPGRVMSADASWAAIKDHIDRSNFNDKP
ncbi:type II toxin-antitoxin system ParD family antitoxin [Rhizobiaceae bacterium CRRU44]|uniref:Type II toxin-antitoxin system ParD family antitoxin n=1 Tax=Ferranicluibacter rubi TaxID=2715133 RepID=A0AA43ZBT6_9HYPH|nr:type II toxin-antitoxin system ParD family antitoxin [Ferranicluibacter rubi]NHT74953.1 type II toxin-antitoxin system ParD family antitoxin [Ferranicluibacter rubi]